MAQSHLPVSIGELPPGVRLLPLAGVILLPHSELPLNIFEPRYRMMVADSLASDQLVALVQPRAEETPEQPPALYDVGTLGRIGRYRETDDGRFLIALVGICRFRLRRELPADTPYRQAEVDYHEFAADLHEGTLHPDSRSGLEAALLRFVTLRGYEADWTAIRATPDEVLVSALSMASPLRPAERQALLEAADLEVRAAMLVTLMQLAEPGPPLAGLQ